MTYVEELFNRVVFDEDDRAYHKKLYEEVKELCKGIEKNIPSHSSLQNESLHLAFQSFSLALMHIGTALSRSNKYKN